MAGIFRKIFGFTHKKENEKKPQDTVPQKTGGFSVKVAVPADPTLYAPVVTQCNGNGGVQASSLSLSPLSIFSRWFPLHSSHTVEWDLTCIFLQGFVAHPLLLQKVLYQYQKCGDYVTSSAIAAMLCRGQGPFTLHILRTLHIVTSFLNLLEASYL